MALCECGCGRTTNLAKMTSKAKGWRQGEPLRFIRGHATSQLRRPLESWWKVDEETGCWLWTGAIMYAGYGLYHPIGTTVRAHRYVYEQYIGPIPEGMGLDHLCCVKHCVNPAHLEPVSNLENTQRYHARKKMVA